MSFTCTLRGAAQTLNLVSSEELKNLGGSGFDYRELSTKEIAEGLRLQRGGLAVLHLPFLRQIFCGCSNTRGQKASVALGIEKATAGCEWTSYPLAGLG